MVALAGLAAGLGSINSILGAGQGILGTLGIGGNKAQQAAQQALNYNMQREGYNASRALTGDVMNLTSQGLDQFNSLVNPQIQSLLNNSNYNYGNASDAFSTSLINRGNQANLLLGGATEVQKQLSGLYGNAVTGLLSQANYGTQAAGNVLQEFAKAGAALPQEYLKGIAGNSGIAETGAQWNNYLAQLGGLQSNATTGAYNLNQALANQTGELARQDLSEKGATGRQAISSQADLTKQLYNTSLDQLGAVNQAGINQQGANYSQYLQSLGNLRGKEQDTLSSFGQNYLTGMNQLGQTKMQEGSKLAQQTPALAAAYKQAIDAQALSGVGSGLGTFLSNFATGAGNVANTSASGLNNISDAAKSGQNLVLQQAADNYRNMFKMQERNRNRVGARSLAFGGFA